MLVHCALYNKLFTQQLVIYAFEDGTVLGLMHFNANVQLLWVEPLQQFSLSYIYNYVYFIYITVVAFHPSDRANHAI